MDSSLFPNIVSVFLNVMTDNNTERSFVTSTIEVDRISCLPENLIDLILEKLPVQDAVRTHALSKKWGYKWITLSSVVLDKHFSEKFAKNGALHHNGLIRITNQIFNFLKGPLLKLHLHIPNMVLDSFQEVDQWILSLSRDELRMLELENCIIKPPIDFQGFLYLEKLLLGNIEFGANLHGTIINLPQLKMLKLVACTNVDNFKIKSTKLFRLLVLNCPDATLLPLLHSKCLIVVAIVFKNPIQGVERVNLASLLSNMPCLGYLLVDGYFLQLKILLSLSQFCIAENMPKWLPHPANSLKFLNLQNFKFGDLFQLQGVLCILRNSPYLERINVTSQGLRNVHLDVNPALTYLETSNYLDQTLNRSKTINIFYVERS
ncbi:F-box/FBD/LRR-repeat protein At1g13570-like [Rutidosis leptorrhynchoides]|uniref:F-box/FBD/LRR-repeat protein At1g13570-like n=1 Tax=Rutidosis leptorrhynchoides TaxID=125765 RepID=UPI003A996ABC